MTTINQKIIIILTSPEVEGASWEIESPKENLTYASAYFDYDEQFPVIKTITVDNVINDWKFTDRKISDQSLKIEEALDIDQFFVYPGGKFYHHGDISIESPDTYIFVNQLNDVFLVQSIDFKYRRLFKINIENLSGHFITPIDHYLVDYKISQDEKAILYTTFNLDNFAIIDDKIYNLEGYQTSQIVKTTSNITALFRGSNFTKNLNDARIRNYCIGYTIEHYGITYDGKLYFVDDLGNMTVIAKDVKEVIPRKTEDEILDWYFVIFKDNKVGSLLLPEKKIKPLDIIIPDGEFVYQSNDYYVTVLVNPTVSFSQIYVKDSNRITIEKYEYQLIENNNQLDLPFPVKGIPENKIIFPMGVDPNDVPFPGIEAILLNDDRETLPIPPDASWLNIARIIEMDRPITQILSLTLQPPDDSRRKFLYVTCK